MPVDDAIMNYALSFRCARAPPAQETARLMEGAFGVGKLLDAERTVMMHLVHSVIATCSVGVYVYMYHHVPLTKIHGGERSSKQPKQGNKMLFRTRRTDDERLLISRLGRSLRRYVAVFRPLRRHSCEKSELSITLHPCTGIHVG